MTNRGDQPANAYMPDIGDFSHPACSTFHIADNYAGNSEVLVTMTYGGSTGRGRSDDEVGARDGAAGEGRIAVSRRMRLTKTKDQTGQCHASSQGSSGDEPQEGNPQGRFALVLPADQQWPPFSISG